MMTSYGGLGIGGVTRPYVYLYECDQLGVFCQEIYIYTGWRVSTGEAESWTASLITDYAAETISLSVNGENVYTYHPE
ncbi:MAG: hypothetical protein H6671_06340 [Anaerolineaceae bacterium]|nr:hypothetical protein [Anaerolineaceae bacterium]